MAYGVGGQNRDQVLAALGNMSAGVEEIGRAEFESRIANLRNAMVANSVQATLLTASASLYYFTGLKWQPSERLVGAVIFDNGTIKYIAPHFESDTLRDHWLMEAEIKLWQEHENPGQTLRELLAEQGMAAGEIFVDPATPFFMIDNLSKTNPHLEIKNGLKVIQSIRSIKSNAELAIIRQAHRMTLEVQKAAAAILEKGIRTTEVCAFIDEAHSAVGANEGSSFCIVLFGQATSFPHGVKEPQVLREDDWVLVDTGCLLQGYHSDITRTYPYGQPTDRQRAAWKTEQDAQRAAFNTALAGQPCEVPDFAARRVLEAAGYGPDYELPGLPHRTGHGCGLDIHEGPFLVRGEQTLLSPGQVFSCEPMLVLPGEFGVRLEDHFAVTESGPKWFTDPSLSIDDPFALL